MRPPEPRFLVLRRMTGEIVLTTERDLEGGYAFDADKHAVDPGEAGLSIAGGASKAENLAKRLRRVSPEKQRALRTLQRRIAKLQRDHTALIATLHGDGIVLSPRELVAIAARKPKVRQKKGESVFTYYGGEAWVQLSARDDKARGSGIRTVQESLEPVLSIGGKEAVK
jgi:hypothetical protein